MLLAHCTWPDIESYAARSAGVMVPIGSTEQHGPTGLIGTDSICAAAVAARAGERAGALVGPAIELTAAQFNLGFAGTISVRASVLQALVADYVRSLARHGLTRVYFVNGHGANVAVAQAAFHDIYMERSLCSDPQALPDVRCRLRSWWEFDAVGALRDALYGAAEGLHATPSEVAIAYHVLSGAVPGTALAPVTPLSAAERRDLAGDRHADAHRHRAAHPDGRVGSDPTLATTAHGARLLEAAAEAVADDFVAFVGSP